MNKSFILIFILIPTLLFCGTRHKAGATVNSISGSGICYSYRINKSWYLEANSFVYFQGDDPSQQLETHILAGLELQKSLWHKGSNRIYGFAGASFWYIDNAITFTKLVEVREVEFTRHEINRIGNFGLGIGWEINFFKDFYLSISSGLLYQTSEIYQTGELIDRSPNGTSYFGPGLGLSLKYAF